VLRKSRPVNLVALAILMALPACTWASDQDPQPLFVIRGGRRVPVSVIPARRSSNGSRQAVLQVVQAGQPGDEWVPDSVRPFERPGDELGGQGQPYGMPARRQEIAYYAGYPVSYYYPTDTEWWQTGPAYPNPYNTDYGVAVEQLYRGQRYVYQRERGRRFNEVDMQRRRDRALSNSEKALRTGLGDMKSGDYEQAVLALTMATQLNQGDPASRIHLAQAQMAMGHYEEAAAALRRALQLQPNLKFIPLDLGRYYSDPQEFDEQVQRLCLYATGHAVPADVYFLLGYMEFQREDFAQANAAFQIALSGAPNDALVREYVKLTQPPR
jgi:tetratricopeptide (TPR) repeat protein